MDEADRHSLFSKMIDDLSLTTQQCPIARFFTYAETETPESIYNPLFLLKPQKVAACR